MRQLLARLVAVALILSTTACGSGDGPDFIWLRAMNAMSDSPTMRVSYENYVFRRDLPFGNLTDEGGESLLSSSGSTARLTLDYFQPRGELGGAILELDVPVEKDATSTVIFAGNFDAPQPITIVSPRLKRPLPSLTFQFAHAALDLGAVDVYVTAPDTALSATAPLVAGLQPRAHSGALEVPFGATRIRLTPAGTLDVLMDSGELEFPELEAATGPGAQWLFAITPSTASGPSPVFLTGSPGRASFRFFDAGTPAALRILHAVADAPAVDVFAVEEIAAEGDEEAEPETIETVLYQGLEYRVRSPLVPAPTEEFTLAFRLAEVAEGEEGDIASVDVNLARAAEYSVFLIDGLEAPGLRIDDQPTRSVVTEARLRFAHLVPEGKFYSIYLTESEDQPFLEGDRMIRDLRFGIVASNVVRPPGEYFITFTERFFEDQADAPDAVETAFFGPVPLELVGGDVLTFAVFEPENEGEPSLVQIFDDLQP
jgi:hypothetical protein